MTELMQALMAGLEALSVWELLAVVLAIAYLVLAIRQNAWCWVAALASAAIYLVLMFQAKLYMQSVLQVFYIAMAFYGWWRWKKGGVEDQLPVISWSAKDHIKPLGLILVSGLIFGLALERYSDAVMPFADALVATGAVVTTWMVANKVLQNWHYWFVIDAISVWLYASQGLILTAGLFLVYLVLVVVGWRSWRASMHG